MKIRFILIVVMLLLIACTGCIVYDRDHDYGRHRDHRDYDDHRDRDRDHDDRDRKY